MMSRLHLHRLATVDGAMPPVYFVTTCTLGRRRVLATPTAAGIIRQIFRESLSAWGWRIGRYVVVPDHVHFFCSPDDPALGDLSTLVRRFKSLAAVRLARQGAPGAVWQPEFFDHLLRHGESYQQKWEYVRDNPVRAGLVPRTDLWPYQGEIDEICW